jgi:hypothetical protein
MSAKVKYQKFARKCIELQKRTPKTDECLLFLQMAQTWWELARPSEEDAEASQHLFLGRQYRTENETPKLALQRQVG